jgi:hypothetical protein
VRGENDGFRQGRTQGFHICQCRLQARDRVVIDALTRCLEEVSEVDFVESRFVALLDDGLAECEADGHDVEKQLIGGGLHRIELHATAHCVGSHHQ